MPRCKSKLVAAGTAALMAVVAPARASLTASEADQVRGYVAEESHADRVRALIARPDLTADEAASAMAGALKGAVIDAGRIAFLNDVVSGAPSASSRPALTSASVRGLLARVDVILAQQAAELERRPAVAEEIARAYDFVGGQMADAATDDATRADCAKALGEHFTRNLGVLRLEAPTSARLAHLRAQIALALLDALGSGPVQRVDAADKLGLTGVRRATLIELGVLILDAAGSEEKAKATRALLDRLPGARDGVEAVFIGDERAVFRSRQRVVAVNDAPAVPLGDVDSPWGTDADPPDVQAATMAIAEGLAGALVARAMEQRPALRAQVEHDGGQVAVARMAAMLAVAAPLTVEVAAARLLAGKRENVAWTADALGALAVYAGPPSRADGVALTLGGSRGNGLSRASHIALDPSGAASAFQLDGHVWHIGRDASGSVTGMRRDGVPVMAFMLPASRAAVSEAASWTGVGLVFARLAGNPRAGISAGPRVHLLGSTVGDAISAPSPGADVVVDANLRVSGGPGGVAARAVPGSRGFQGISVMVIPGAPAHAVLLVGDGMGNETAAAPVVEVRTSRSYHVRLTVRGREVEAVVAGISMTATLPDSFAHGDVALRAYPGVSVDATQWRVSRP